MKFREYIDETAKTWNQQEEEQANLEHSLIGLVEAAGELASSINQKVGFGGEIDLSIIKSEIGAETFYLSRVMACLYKDEHLDTLADHLDTIAVSDLSPEGKEAMTNYQYTDIVFGLIHPFINLYSTIVEQKGAETAQAIADSFTALRTVATYFNIDIVEAIKDNVK